MVDWKYLLYAQYPAFLLLSLLFFLNNLLARKNSAVKSIIWVLLFAVSLVAAVVCAILGIQQEYWTLKTLLPLSFASWIGVIIVAVMLVAHIVHTIEKKHNKRVMEKELKKAEKVKDDAVAQAREEGRLAAHQEAEAVRLSKAAEAADAEALASEVGQAAGAPIELRLDAPVSPEEPLVQFDQAESPEPPVPPEE